MAKFLRFEECPRCVANGRDRRGDNLAVYSDGGAHCFSCSYHKSPDLLTRLTKVLEKPNVDEDKAVLPADFTREVPTAGWKWLLQYGLSYQYWKPYTGYSETHDRLILTVGDPIKASIGRAIDLSPYPDGKPKRKWRVWGDVHRFVEILGQEYKKGTSSVEAGQERKADGPVVLVEDLISAHKVGQVATCICLFGTDVHDAAVRALQALNRPVVLWLDGDQYSLLPKKIGRLQSLLKRPVRYVYTEKDPKEYSIEEIKTMVLQV